MLSPHPGRYRLFPCLALSHQESLEMQKLCRTEWERASAFFEPNDPILEYTSVFQGYEVLPNPSACFVPCAWPRTRFTTTHDPATVFVRP